MKGFTLGNSRKPLGKVAFHNFELSLLSRGDGVEVLLQTINEGSLFYVYPGDNPTGLEFYYVLSGEMECDVGGEKKRLGPEDYFSAQGLVEPIHFTALTQVTLLWAVTDPTFFHLSKDMSILMGKVKEVEQKDRYTSMHSDRVAKYCVKIAKKLKLNKDQLENLTMASLLHDVGKIHVPAEILNKPDRLTDDEFSIIKKHPQDGANMIKETYYKELVPIIEQHHERLDGSGYPHGLKAEDILLEARIIAVSDTFDAMTEDRAYRKAFSKEHAMEELKRLSGKHYDQEIVQAFEEILKEEGIL
ncbi:HD domain-containing protein [Rossellomorea vietnamensis]|uniref:HD domain-containing protein n=1 Tax=Rossellomorea vietnamensis TaxID=218284 RepID=A0ACD4CD47_9BACI|nr:HD domain-containing phosphohydrolase [Rossellomorea vietnamensis]UXH46196.1 HD domain-containing protein [Rossellomorea vietnamensis]